MPTFKIKTAENGWPVDQKPPVPEAVKHPATEPLRDSNRDPDHRPYWWKESGLLNRERSWVESGPKTGPVSYWAYRAERPTHEWRVEIETLEQLLAMIARAGHDFIVGPGEITIYDGYME